MSPSTSHRPGGTLNLQPPGHAGTALAQRHGERLVCVARHIEMLSQAFVQLLRNVHQLLALLRKLQDRRRGIAILQRCRAGELRGLRRGICKLLFFGQQRLEFSAPLASPNEM